jgi:hypothetical protein
MKPSNIKGAAMPIYAILAQFKILARFTLNMAQVKVREAQPWQNQAT